MNLVSGAIGGLIGSIIGAAVWAAVAYFTGYEIGWIAWGVGVLCGFGVAIGTRGQGGPPAGVLAVLLSLLGIAGGKWFANEWYLDSFYNSDDLVISAIADDIQARHEEAGRRFRPKSTVQDDDSDYTIASEYAPDVWQEAQQRLRALSPEEQDRIRKYPPYAHQDATLIYIADQIVDARYENDQHIEWPETIGEDDVPWRKAHYPADVWAEAEARWNKLNADEQQAFVRTMIATESDRLESAMADFRAQISTEGFFASFGLLDLLFIALAVGSAFQIGSGKRQPSAETANT
jgi:hypothetical protein